VLTWLGEPASEFLEALIDTLDGNPDVYFIAADSDGRVLGCNRAIAQLLDVKPDELPDKSIWDQLTAADSARLSQGELRTSWRRQVPAEFCSAKPFTNHPQLQSSDAILPTVCDSRRARAKFVQCL
jgi:PAS domain-containing protein